MSDGSGTLSATHNSEYSVSLVVLTLLLLLSLLLLSFEMTCVLRRVLKPLSGIDGTMQSELKIIRVKLDFHHTSVLAIIQINIAAVEVETCD
jgi:hypothetical protein